MTAKSEALQKYETYKAEVVKLQSDFEVAKKHKAIISGDFRLCKNCISNSNENVLRTTDLMLLKNVNIVLGGLNTLKGAGTNIEWWLDNDLGEWIADVENRIKIVGLPEEIKNKKIKMEQFVKFMTPIEQIELIDKP